MVSPVAPCLSVLGSSLYQHSVSVVFAGSPHFVMGISPIPPLPPQYKKLLRLTGVMKLSIGVNGVWVAPCLSSVGSGIGSRLCTTSF